jgi:hypothetical protein
MGKEFRFLVSFLVRFLVRSPVSLFQNGSPGLSQHTLDAELPQLPLTFDLIYTWAGMFVVRVDSFDQHAALLFASVSFQIRVRNTRASMHVLSFVIDFTSPACCQVTFS